MGYLTPADVPVSDDYWGHRNRPTPSREPGTDYATPYGTPLRVADSGTVYSVDRSPDGAEGRRVSITLDDGRVVDYIHLSDQIPCYPGQRLARGQLFAESGASGYGQDWYYGAHVHVTLRPHRNTPYAYSINFEEYTDSGATAGGGSRPFPTDGAEMNAEEWRQFQVLAGTVNEIAASVEQIQLAVGSLQRYVYFGDKDLPAERQVVTNTIGATESIFGITLAAKAQIDAISKKVDALEDPKG